MRELSCIQYPPQHHTRIICSRSRPYAPMLRDDNAVSAPRPHALHRGPVTQPQCHVLHVVLHRSHEPSCSRLIDTLVLLEHRLLTDARARDERAVRPHTVSSFVQRSGAARAPDCSQVPRGRWCVDRRLSCGTDMWHDASTGCSICGRSVRRLQQHVGAVALAASCGLLRPWTERHVDSGHHHICVHR